MNGYAETFKHPGRLAKGVAGGFEDIGNWFKDRFDNANDLANDLEKLLEYAVEYGPWIIAVFIILRVFGK